MTDLERGPSSDGAPSMHASSLNNSPQSYYTGVVERLPQIAGRCSYEQDRMDVVAAATIISDLQAEVDHLKLECQHACQEIEVAIHEREVARSSLSRIKAETIEEVITAVEQNAFQIMLDVVNEWHRQVGIDDVMKSKLTQKRADTVATGVFKRSIASAIRSLATR